VIVGHFTPAYRELISAQMADCRQMSAAWARSQGHAWHQHWRSCCSIDVARNGAVAWSRKHGHDWLMMQDSDCWATGEEPALESLMRTLTDDEDAAVVAAGFRLRTGDERFSTVPWMPDDICQADQVGAGMMLIDMVALAELPLPWFITSLSDDGTSVTCGEDTHFSRIVRAAGHVIVADGTIPTMHGDIVGLSNGVTSCSR
jgi:hypothetical protein